MKMKTQRYNKTRVKVSIKERKVNEVSVHDIHAGRSCASLLTRSIGGIGLEA